MFLIVMCAPASGTLEIRNVPILIAVLSVAALIFAYYMITHFVFSLRVRRACKDKKVFAVPLVIRKKNCKYHFEEIDKIEIYKTTRVAFKGVRSAPVRWGETQTKLVKRKKIKIPKDILNDTSIEKCIVISRMPACVTDKSSRQEKGNGDTLCNTNVKIFDYNAFSKSGIGD